MIFPRFAKYLIRCENSLDMIFYYDDGENSIDLPQDQLGDYLENYFKQILQQGESSFAVKHLKKTEDTASSSSTFLEPP